MDLYASNPGPIDDSVLYEQDKHVSSAVWDGQERGALRCHEHTSKLDQWKLTAKQLDLVKKAGFWYLRLIPAISLDNPLISALVERWRRETNTFHLNVGEMTVTLEDVAYLIGLAIEGEPVIGLTYTTCDEVCQKFLGKAPDRGYVSGGMVKLSWLKEFFSQCPEDAPDEVIERHTRAYLLYLVGSTIFSTTTGNKVPVMYLQLFEDFDQAGKYAWGAATLAFLYRALGNASIKTQSTISGCLTLLQCWSYYHLNVGRPKLNQDPLHDCFPLVLKWKGKQSGPTTNRDVGFYRKAFDSLKPCDVEWVPYAMVNNTIIPEEIETNLIMGRSETMLICFDKAERHLPDRCLRQYGMPQPIPKEVQRWERKSRGVDGGVDLSGKMESELNEWLERRHHIVEGYEGIEESTYMQWYLNITRKFVGRPIPISSEYQKMNATLKEIVQIADAISTHGMDEEQIQAVTRIRYISHECLRDQGGSSLVVSATPETEVGKRGRGKERVRRRGTVSKRKRKDDPEIYLAPREDDHSQLYDADADVSQLYHVHEVEPLCHVANHAIDDPQLCTVSMVDVSPLCHMDTEIDHSLPCHLDYEVHNSLPPHVGNAVDNSQPSHEVSESKPQNETQSSHAASESKPQPSDAARKSDPQPSDAASVSDPQLSPESSNGVAMQNDYSVV